jgi:tetratricopeptide (TPR) repeat protein
MLGWRHDESREVCERALELAREIGARRSAFRALAVLGVDLAYLGRGEEGLGCLWEALHLAEDLGVPEELGRAYTLLTDVLTMLGRPRESVQVAATGITLARKYGREHGRNMPLAVNLMEALFDLGEWEEADRVGAAAIRAGGAPWPHQRLVARAVLDIGRGDYDRARVGLQAALATVHDDKRGLAAFDIARAELALWERRWDDAEHAVAEGLRRLPAREAAHLRVRLCVQGLRAQAELAALARARRDGSAVTDRLQRARRLLGEAREAATGAAAVTRPPRRGGRSPRPNTTAPGSVPSRDRGRRRPPRGRPSSARRSSPTAAGVRPRPWLPPALPRLTPPLRPGMPSPSRDGWARGRSRRRSSGSRGVRGWTSHRRYLRPAGVPGWRTYWA